MDNFERIKCMTKEELAKEIRLIANWDRKHFKKAEKMGDKFYLDWLEAECDPNRISDGKAIKCCKLKLKELQPFLTAERVNLYIETGKPIEYEIWGYEGELSEYRKYKDVEEEEGDTMFLRYGDYNVEEIGSDGENSIYIGINK